LAEHSAIASLFVGGASPFIGSIKGALGETLGAATSFSVAHAVDALQTGRLDAVGGMRPPYLSKRYLVEESAAGDFNIAMVNSVELTGNISSLILRRSLH